MTFIYAISRTSNDRFLVEFQPHCERTVCDNEALFALIRRLDEAGYDLKEECFGRSNHVCVTELEVEV
jgi:hypothetical protein